MHKHIQALALLLAANAKLTSAAVAGVADTWEYNADAPEVAVDGVQANVTSPILDNWRSVYGANLCAGTGVIEWEVLVTMPHDDPTNAWDYAIGVAKGARNPTGLFVREPGSGFAYFAQTGRKDDGDNQPYADTYADGDLIKVRLDLDLAEIEFFKNGVSQGIAFSNIDVSGTWSVAVSFSSHDYAARLSGGSLPDTCIPPAEEPPAEEEAAAEEEVDALNGASAAVKTDSNDLPDGAIAGIVVGAVALAAIVLAVVFVVRRKFSRKRDSTVAPDVEAGAAPKDGDVTPREGR